MTGMVGPHDTSSKDRRQLGLYSDTALGYFSNLGGAQGSVCSWWGSELGGGWLKDEGFRQIGRMGD